MSASLLTAFAVRARDAKRLRCEEPAWATSIDQLASKMLTDSWTVLEEILQHLPILYPVRLTCKLFSEIVNLKKNVGIKIFNGRTLSHLRDYVEHKSLWQWACDEHKRSDHWRTWGPERSPSTNVLHKRHLGPEGLELVPCEWLCDTDIILAFVARGDLSKVKNMLTTTSARWCHTGSSDPSLIDGEHINSAFVPIRLAVALASGRSIEMVRYLKDAGVCGDKFPVFSRIDSDDYCRLPYPRHHGTQFVADLANLYTDWYTDGTIKPEYLDDKRLLPTVFHVIQAGNTWANVQAVVRCSTAQHRAHGYGADSTYDHENRINHTLQMHKAATKCNYGGTYNQSVANGAFDHMIELICRRPETVTLHPHDEFDIVKIIRKLYGVAARHKSVELLNGIDAWSPFEAAAIDASYEVFDGRAFWLAQGRPFNVQTVAIFATLRRNDGDEEALAWALENGAASVDDD